MSYDDTLPTDRDKARALLGDTTNDPATELLTDAHMDSALLLYGFNGGVAFMATGLASRFSQSPTSTSLPSGLSASWSERVAQWRALAKQMQSGGGIGATGAFSHTPTRSDGYSEYEGEGL